MGLGPFLFLLLCRFWALAHFSTIWTCWKWFKASASFCFWEFVYTFSVYTCIPYAYDVQNLYFSFKLRILCSSTCISMFCTCILYFRLYTSVYSRYISVYRPYLILIFGFQEYIFQFPAPCTAFNLFIDYF